MAHFIPAGTDNEALRELVDLTKEIKVLSENMESYNKTMIFFSVVIIILAGIQAFLTVMLFKA